MDLLSEDLAVIKCLIHPESFEAVQQETGFAEKVVLDILRTLVHYRYARVVHQNGKPMKMFSPDDLVHVRFVLTAKGLDAISAK